MVGHDHAVISHFLVDTQNAGHIDISIIGQGLREVEIPTLDIAKMDVEDLAPTAEIADDVRYLLIRVSQHLADRSPAEVQPMITAGRNLYKTLQEVGDALPVELGGDVSGDGQSVRVGPGVVEGAVAGVAAPRRRCRTRHPEQRPVILQQKNAGPGRIADHLADLVHFAIPLR